MTTDLRMTGSELERRNIGLGTGVDRLCSWSSLFEDRRLYRGCTEVARVEEEGPLGAGVGAVSDHVGVPFLLGVGAHDCRRPYPSV